MDKLSKSIIQFFQRQGFVIVSTLDPEGKIHCSAKGIVGADQNKVYLIDLYKARTFNNLIKNPTVTITAVDEHEFIGFALKGTARIVNRDDFKGQVVQDWEEKLINRISKRVIKNVKQDKGSSKHPEAAFPQPEYLIEVEIQEVVDLAPGHLKKSGA